MLQTMHDLAKKTERKHVSKKLQKSYEKVTKSYKKLQKVTKLLFVTFL